MPEEALRAYAGAELSLADILGILWQGKWWIVGAGTLFFVLSIAYALTRTHWYTADVLLTLAEERSSSLAGGALGSLASLAGVTVGAGNSVEPIAVLRSRDFTWDFIEDYDLVPTLLTHADAGAAGEPASTYDAVRFFDENVRSVSQERDTGLVRLTIEWTDPDTAALWANVLVNRLNDRMRQRALQQAEANVKYLREELVNTSVVSLQQSVSSLLETELQKLMLARGNEEFAFRIIDRARPPEERSRPARTLIVVIGTFVGGALGILLVFGRYAWRESRLGSRDGMER